MKTRITQLTIIPDGAPIFDERGFQIEIQDEAGGEFLCINSNDPPSEGIRLDVEDWPDIRAGIDRMALEIKKNERKGEK